MKKLVLLFALCLATAQTFAADLYVREFGSGGAHWTISSAIAAASDGDRIIIEPKAGGIPYVEDVTIDKSVTLMSETFGLKYILQGNITITPAIGRVVTIKNVQMGSYYINSSNSPDGGRMIVNIFESIIDDIILNYNNITANITNNQTTYIGIVHGRVVANSGAHIAVTNETSTTLGGDPVSIIANDLYSSSHINLVKLSSSVYPYVITNNKLRSNNYSASEVCEILGVKANSINYIYNNYFDTNSTSTDGITFEAIGGVSGVVFDIRNNQFELTNSTAVWNIYDSNVGIQVFAYFNKYKGDATIGVDAQASNTSWSVVTDLVDAGHPAVEFLDLDLSNNDVGVNGGSHAWDNYWPASSDTKPQIYFLDMPHRVTTGTTIDVKAAGISK